MKGGVYMMKIKINFTVLTCFIIISVIFSGIAMAHPGHGDYPEEVTDDTSDQTNQNTGSTTTTRDNTKKTTKTTTTKTTKTSSGTSTGIDSSSNDQSTQSGTSDYQNTTNNNDSGSQPLEEVTSANRTNSTSTNSNSIPWSIATLIGVFAVGFGGIALIFKIGHFGRFS